MKIVKFCLISTFNKILVNTLSGLPRVFDLKKKATIKQEGENPVSYYSRHMYIAVIDNLFEIINYRLCCLQQNRIYSVDSSF